MILTKTKKCFLIGLFVFFVLLSCTYNLLTEAMIASAFDTNKFDSTNVLEDLNSSTVGDKKFDIKDFPYDDTVGDKYALQVINFVEYCYSYRMNMQDNFGLYVYLYNPKGLNIDVNSRSNKIQIAVAYNSSGDAIDYEKFNLQFCSKTEGIYNNLFYKFKVIDHKSNDGKKIVERVHNLERRYDVSSVELLSVGSRTAYDYFVGGTYSFSGYTKGYGADDSESNIVGSVKIIETLSLDVKHTNFRPDIVSAEGRGHQNNVSSVYFSIDNAIMEKYGNLQKIKATWYEYKTTPILSVLQNDSYNGLLPYVGQIINGPDAGVPYAFHMLPKTKMYCYNHECVKTNRCSHRLNTLNYLFSTGGLMPQDFVLKGHILEDYIYNYDKSFINGTLDIKSKTISADLFQNSVDNGRTKGLNVKDIDLKDTFSLKSYDSNHNWVDRFLDFGFMKINTGGDYNDKLPIEKVRDENISSPNISRDLLINEGDKSSFVNFYNKSKSDNKSTFLFRFAQTDYFSEFVPLKNPSNNFHNASIATETVFLDFDIIQLTFNNDGEYHVIPVVSNPIDIISDITGPLGKLGDGFLKSLLTLLLIILGIIIFILIMAPLLPLIIQGVVVLISIPFRLIGAVAKSTGGSAKKKKKYKKRRVK